MILRGLSIAPAGVLLLEVSLYSSPHSTQSFSVATIAHDPSVVHHKSSISNRVSQIRTFRQHVLSFAVVAAVVLRSLLEVIGDEGG